MLTCAEAERQHCESRLMRGVDDARWRTFSGPWPKTGHFAVPFVYYKGYLIILSNADSTTANENQTKAGPKGRSCDRQVARFPGHETDRPGDRNHPRL